jgi:hypothetical protein
MDGMVAAGRGAPSSDTLPHMTTPRTIAGQAAISAMRPHVRRALAQTIVAIEDEAAAPYLAALREADAVLEALIAAGNGAGNGTGNGTGNGAGNGAAEPGGSAGLVERAEAARGLARPLLDPV